MGHINEVSTRPRQNINFIGTHTQNHFESQKMISFLIRLTFKHLLMVSLDISYRDTHSISEASQTKILPWTNSVVICNHRRLRMKNCKWQNIFAFKIILCMCVGFLFFLLIVQKSGRLKYYA